MSVKQIPILRRFASDYFFDDDIDLKIYMDFKRESDQDMTSLVKSIEGCRQIKDLTIGGSPNHLFLSSLFVMLGNNKNIRKLHIDMEYIQK